MAEETFSIFEVSELLGVPPHVLRYWESEFSLPAADRDDAGRRIYNAEDVALVRRIKESLYDEQCTIAETKRRLAERR
ncbi:MAG TPA: MerR family transcriptional regulator [Pyrinomonadaceae bacterium]